MQFAVLVSCTRRGAVALCGVSSRVFAWGDDIRAPELERPIRRADHQGRAHGAQGGGNTFAYTQALDTGLNACWPRELPVLGALRAAQQRRHRRRARALRRYDAELARRVQFLGRTRGTATMRAAVGELMFMGLCSGLMVSYAVLGTGGDAPPAAISLAQAT